MYETVIRDAFRRIQTFPEIGRPSQNASEERELILRHHIIVYRYADEVVTILRIVNPRRGGR